MDWPQTGGAAKKRKTEIRRRSEDARHQNQRDQKKFAGITVWRLKEAKDLLKLAARSKKAFDSGS